MASTDTKSDWVYYVMQYMKSLNPNSTFYRYAMNTWEGKTNSEDRAAVEDTMLPYIDRRRKEQGNQTNVGTIFLEYADNIGSDDKGATYVEDTKAFIAKLRERYPNATIYYVYGFYNVPKNMPLVKQATSEANVKLIDYSEMVSTPRYTSFNGARFWNQGGTKKVLGIDSAGAGHPGDYGFAKIANIVIKYLKQDKYCEIRK